MGPNVTCLVKISDGQMASKNLLNKGQQGEECMIKSVRATSYHLRIRLLLEQQFLKGI